MNYMPQMCENLVDTSTPHVEFENTEDGPDGWKLRICRLGKAVIVQYKTGGSMYDWKYTTDENLRNWGVPRDRYGGRLDEEEMEDTRWVACEILRNQAWFPGSGGIGYFDGEREYGAGSVSGGR